MRCTGFCTGFHITPYLAVHFKNDSFVLWCCIQYGCQHLLLACDLVLGYQFPPTLVGTRLSVVVPSPRPPLPLYPQQYATPVVVIPQE